MIEKCLILDSGPLINFSMNGLLYLLERLKQNFKGKFLITEEVKKEVYDHPINIKQFELGALRIEKLLTAKIIELPDSVGIDKNFIDKKTDDVVDIINHSFKAEDQWIPLVSKAEASCLALSEIMSKKGTENIIGVDERTIRVFCEKPENLANLMAKKLHKRIVIDNPRIKELQKFRFIRSSELAYVAYKKNLTSLTGKKALEALLYATKYKGASISLEEVEIMKRL